MPNCFRFEPRFAIFASFTALTAMFGITPARADFPYTPILNDDNYEISFTSASSSTYKIKSYEKVDGVWTPVYYNYSYKIKDCTGAICRSCNYIKSDQHGQDVTQNFYGASSAVKAAVNNINFKMGNLTGDFIGNTGSQAGAIINAKDAGSNVYNAIEIGDIRGDFIDNSSKQAGGAIVNNADISGNLSGSRASIKSITGNFLANSSMWGGGAIYNYTNDVDKIAIIGDINANFIANKSEGMGGAIQNYGSIGNIRGNFISNSGYDGGAIQTAYEMGGITGNFLANKAEGGLRRSHIYFQ